MPTFAMGYHYIQKKGYYEQFVRLYTFSRNTTDISPTSWRGKIGKRRVGKECRSRWSPYH